MKIFLILCLPLCPVLVHAVAFVDTATVIFRVRGGADSSTTAKNPQQGDDYDRAETAIFRGIVRVEAKLQEAVEEEVHAIFDEGDHHRHLAEKAKKAVTKGSSKVKQAVAKDTTTTTTRKNKKSSMPFLVPKKHAEEEAGHHDHKILHAVEAAEKAVLHAVQEEVDNLFHGLAHLPLAHNGEEKNCPKKTSKAKEGVQKGLERARAHVEDGHDKRRRWMLDMNAGEIDEYLQSTNSMYGMGF